MSNYFKYFFVLIFVCLISLNSNAFPKKKHSIIKDDIDKREYSGDGKVDISRYGYFYGYLEYCSFAQTQHKDTYKRVKGLVAYVNWNLFLVFNKGIQAVNTTLVTAGVGWAGGSLYIADNWQQHNINWKYNLTDCGASSSMSLAYKELDTLIETVLINFMLERDNFDTNYSNLITALQSDKRDDYSGIISRLKNASNPDNLESSSSSSEETLISQDNSNEDSSDDIVTQLKKLKALFEDDLISQDEYNTKKKELLDKM